MSKTGNLIDFLEEASKLMESNPNILEVIVKTSTTTNRIVRKEKETKENPEDNKENKSKWKIKKMK